MTEVDAVDEASDESFPASDPPSFTSMHAGAPAHAPEAKGVEEPSEGRWRRGLIRAGGALFVVGGLWSMVRTHGWRAKATGVAVACIGVGMLLSARRY